jgi:hypothetical protein
MDAYPLAQLPQETTVVFVAATTGQVRVRVWPRALLWW